MAGRRPSGWTILAAAAILIAAAVVFWAMGRETVEEASTIRPPEIELPDPRPPAPDPDPFPAPAPGPT